MPKLRMDSFKEKLPGKMEQNRSFIRYLSLLVFEELEKDTSEEFLESDTWTLYLLTKELSELACAHCLSERQVVDMEAVIHSLVDLRIKLHIDNPPPLKGRKKALQSADLKGKAQVNNGQKSISKRKGSKGKAPVKKGKKMNVADTKGKDDTNLLRPAPKILSRIAGGWPPVSPKHTFLLSYGDITRETGTPIHCSTVRYEGKNGAINRMAKLANNKKNTLATIIRLENKFQATSSRTGVFSESRLVLGQEGNPSKNIQAYLTAAFGSDWESKYYLADNVTFKGTFYCNTSHHSVLVHEDFKKDFEAGLIKQLLVPKGMDFSRVEPLVVYQKTVKIFLPRYGVYKVTLKEDYYHESFDKLAHYFPLYLFKPKNKECLYLSLKCKPLLL